MANTIRQKRGTTVPVVGSFTSTAELLVNTTDGTIYNKTDGGVVVRLSPDTGCADGTAAAPSIAFANSTGTGFWRPAANTLAASTAGTERLRIDSSGRVGIGTSAPVGRVHSVAASSNAALTLTTPDTGNARLTHLVGGNNYSYGVVGIVAGDGTQYGDVYGLGSSSNSTGSFSPTLTWTTTPGQNLPGRVGIGTASPTGKLNIAYGTGGTAVNDGLYLTESDSTGIYTSSLRFDGTLAHLYGARNGGELRLENNGAGVVTAYTNGLERTRITSAGNVGIGTTSPGVPLDVVADSSAVAYRIRGRTSDNIGDIQFTDNGATTAYVNLRAPAANTFAILTGGSERARIDSSGRLLVGTSATTGGAVALLQVQGYSGGSTGVGLLELKRGAAVPANGDELGRIDFSSSNSERGATITTVRDGGTWTAGSSHPGRLVFSTTADGAANPTERFRINSNGFASHTGAIGRGAPVTKTANFTLGIAENWIICNGTATITVTLPTASAWTGREVIIKTIAAFTVVSAASDVVPLAGGAAGTAILAATAGKYATLVSDGTSWIIMQAN